MLRETDAKVSEACEMALNAFGVSTENRNRLVKSRIPL